MKKHLQRSEPKDEPGAEDRFLRGVRKAVKTPPKPFTKKAKGKGRASDHKSKES